VLQFTNAYSSPVWVMIEWHNPDCSDGSDWEKKGWWQIEPGASKVPFGGDLSDTNQTWYFYAHADDGSEWAGEFQETVPPTAFDWCSNTSNTESRTIGMRELDLPQGQSDHTIRLTGSSGAPGGGGTPIDDG
jgi:uncharacterized membrane protein